MKGLATIVEHVVMTIVHQRGNVSFYSSSISSKVCMKLKMHTSVIGGNLPRTKLDHFFVTLVSIKPDISLKLNEGLDIFIRDEVYIPIRLWAFWL